MVGHFCRLLVWCLVVQLFYFGNGLAADSKLSRAQNQVDVTIVHVDKYGVYGPKLVFYWDTSMSKKKVEELTKAAEQLRNKKVTVTYSALGDLSTDKRPLLVELSAVKDEMSPKEESKFSIKKGTSKEEFGLSSKKEPIHESDEESGAADDEVDNESQDLNDREEEAVQIPMAKEGKRRAAGEGAVEDSTSKKTALIGEQKRPTEFEQKPARSSASSAAITKEEIMAFIQRLLRLNETKDIDSVLACYADQINYYDRGVVTKDYIRKDMGYYFRNWNTITSSMDGDLVMIITDQQDTRIVKFVSRYQVQNANKLRTGRVENIWKVQRINNDLKIVDQKQKILAHGIR